MPEYKINNYRLYYKHEWDKWFIPQVWSTSGLMAYPMSGHGITDLFHWNEYFMSHCKLFQTIKRRGLQASSCLHI